MSTHTQKKDMPVYLSWKALIMNNCENGQTPNKLSGKVFFETLLLKGQSIICWNISYPKIYLTNRYNMHNLQFIVWMRMNNMWNKLQVPSTFKSGSRCNLKVLKWVKMLDKQQTRRYVVRKWNCPELDIWCRKQILST